MSKEEHKCYRLECDIQTTNAKFCSISCAAKVNNLGVVRRGRAEKVRDCPNCGKKINGLGKRANKYCDHKCGTEYDTKQKLEKIKEAGNLNPDNYAYDSLATMKKYLKMMKGCKCEICDITEWQGQEVPLVFDHIDGNHKNNVIENCRLVCGNCDMQTDTYKGKNKGNGRHARSQRYKDGKSY